MSGCIYLPMQCRGTQRNAGRRRLGNSIKNQSQGHACVDESLGVGHTTDQAVARDKSSAVLRAALELLSGRKTKSRHCLPITASTLPSCCGIARCDGHGTLHSSAGNPAVCRHRRHLWVEELCSLRRHSNSGPITGCLSGINCPGTTCRGVCHTPL